MSEDLHTEAGGLPATGDKPMPLDQAFSGYAGANFSTKRAPIWWPSLDSRVELDSFSRQEIIRRVRWLYGNVGLVKRLVKGLAEMVGYMTPQPTTTDTDWNTKAEANFKNRAGSKHVFDVAGKFNFFSAQSMLMRSSLKDGDILTVMTKTLSGGAQFAFFEGPQLKSPAKTKGEDWFDGVRINKVSRHVAYGISRNDGKDPFIVRAKDAIYFGEFDAVGHPRAVPPLAHAVNHVMDITEIWSHVKSAIKVNSLSGVVRTQKDATGEYKGKQGLVGAVKKTKTADGSTVEHEQVYGDTTIPRLAPGEDLKVVSDPRPEQNQRDLISDLIRDVSWGLNLPPEVVWHLMGLTGPGVRFVLEQLNRWIATKQDFLKEWCRVVWVRHMAMEMAAGRQPQCTDPDWWKVEFIPQRSMTIDRGQSKQRQDEIDGGMGTLADWFKEIDGADWKDKLTQRVAEIKFIKDLCAENEGVEYTDVVSPRQGAAKAEDKEPEPTEDDEK